MATAIPHVSWKSLLLVLLLALGTGLWLRERRTMPAATAQSPTMESGEAVITPGPLIFDQDPVEIRPRPEDEEVEASFTFTHRGDAPLTITGLDSTCSCLEASLDKRTYAPGERGTGRAVFKVSSFVGRHEKQLHLFTDDPEAPEQVLQFILDVPVVVSMEPDLLEWTVGEAPTPKELTIRMVGADPIRVTKVEPSRDNIRHELREVTPGREYRLTVTPTSTADITVGMLKIETDSSIPKYARQLAFFNIVRPELAEKKAAARAQQAEEHKP